MRQETTRRVLASTSTNYRRSLIQTEDKSTGQRTALFRNSFGHLPDFFSACTRRFARERRKDSRGGEGGRGHNLRARGRRRVRAHMGATRHRRRNAAARELRAVHPPRHPPPRGVELLDAGPPRWQVRSMTSTDRSRVIARAAWGVGGLAASLVSTALVPPVAVPVCACAGFAAFVLCCRSALRVARVDELVFERRSLWSAPEQPVPDLPARQSVRVRRRLTAV